MFDAHLTPYTVADFANAIKRNEIKVNYDYQRSPRVWPPAAKSFLIETILLGYPMPKLSLYQITDVKTRKTSKEIVDGQQRSMTIMEFYENKLRIGRNALPPEASGKTYLQLDEDLQHRFLNYQLSVDLFIGATKEDIREVFKRINSYTVPLNAEEKRHSAYQGPFKWFIYRLTKKYSESFRDIGIFTEKQLNRMQDAKLLCEVAHVLFNGVATTKAKELNHLYAQFDKEFPMEDEVDKRMAKALDSVIQYQPLHGGPLMKPHQAYALIVALMHAAMPIPGLADLYAFPKRRPNNEVVIAGLTRLAAAIEDPESEPALEEFVEAGAEKTNVAEQRRKRIVWICRALTDDLP